MIVWCVWVTFGECDRLHGCYTTKELAQEHLRLLYEDWPEAVAWIASLKVKDKLEEIL